MSTCIGCGDLLRNANRRYCSNQCQADYAYKRYIDSWQRGDKTGERGIRAKNISNHVRRYLLEKHGEKCSRCGWSQQNPITRQVPLEIDHIDGNAGNNKEANLQLLCPNCHSLTPGFRNLNRGRGRKWRRDKYLTQGDAALAQLVRASVL